MTLSSPPDLATPVQPLLPFDRLPMPPVVATHLRNTDIEITDAFTPLEKYANARYLYLALLALAAQDSADSVKSDTPHLHVQRGYASLIKFIRQEYEPLLDKWALQKAVKILEQYRYIQRTIKAHGGTEATTYALLKPRAVMEMLTLAGCTHCRILRGRRVQLIRPHPPINSQEVMS